MTQHGPPFPRMPVAELRPDSRSPASILDFRSYCRGILASQPDAVVISDAQRRVALAEGRDLARLGFGSAQSLVGQFIADVFTSATWARLRTCIEEALAGRSSTLVVASSVGVYRAVVSPPVDQGHLGVAVLLSRRDVPADSEVGAVDQGFLASAFDHAPVGMSVLDPDGRWLRVNDEYCRMLGYQRLDLLNRTYRDLTFPEDLSADVEWLDGTRSPGDDVRDLERRYRASNGSTLWVHARSERVRRRDGNVDYIVTVLRDVTEQRATYSALRSSEKLLRSIIDNTPNALSVQGRDGKYRLTNHAFVQRFPLIPGLPLEEQTAADVLPVESIDRDLEDHARVIESGASVEREDIVRQGEEDRSYQSLKFAMGDERGQVTEVCTIYTEVTERRLREAALNERLEWADRLHNAAAQDHFVLFGQPILNLGSGRVEQAELLVRMKDPRRPGVGLLLPGEFLPNAERLGMAAVVDQWVVARAVQLAVNHRIEVNVSAQTMSDPEQVGRLVRLVTDSGAPPSNIIFEITETAVAENIDSAREFATRMHEIGCSFALDDFGTGFGTFTYLKHLPVDYLKIDIEFVRDLVRNQGDHQVVQAIVGVAKQYGMNTVAEGVEDKATLDLLVTLNVDYAQGYWIGRPVPINEVWPEDQSER